MMIKYQQAWYCKVIAMFLAFAILLAIPFSTWQVYAREESESGEVVEQDDSPAEAIIEMDSEGGLPLDSSESIDEDAGEDMPEATSPTEEENGSGEGETSEVLDSDPDASPDEVDMLLEDAEEDPESWEDVKSLEGSEDDKVCAIGDKEYNSLDAALETIGAGENKTITLLKDIDHDKGISLDNKKVTFELNGYTLNIVSSVEHGYALAVYNGGAVFLSGEGALNVTGPARGYGVTVSSNTKHSEVTVTNATAIGTEAKAAHARNKASLTVLEDVKATGVSSYGVHVQEGANIEVRGNVSAENQGVSVSDATVKIDGNVEANGKDFIGNTTGIGINVNKGVAEIGGNVTANRVGVKLRGSGNITIDGIITAPAYIQFNDDPPTAIEENLETTSKPGYRTYQHKTAGTVWVKGASNVCAIGELEYASLGDALAAVKSGETIKLLQNITHTDPITVSGKTIYFDLGDYNLLVDTSTNPDGGFNSVLTLENGGKIRLLGDTGTGKFNIKNTSNAHRHGVRVLGAYSEVTVNNVEVAGGGVVGVYLLGSGVSLDGCTVTINGDIKAENGSGVSVNARNTEVVVNGNIRARSAGVDVASNPNALVTVNGDITVINNLYDGARGILAYSSTTVTVTGNVTVIGADCTGVHAYGGTINVGGNVVSSGMGAKSNDKGEIGINGSLTAGTPFIVVGSTEMAADEGSKNDDGFIVYSDGKSFVIIGSVGNPLPEFTIIVQTNGHGTASANANSAAEGEEITLTATPDEGYRFKEWQVVSGGVSIVNNEFIMPGKNVTIKAIFEPIPAVSYLVTVEGSYAETTGAGNYAKGKIVNIYAGNRSGYSFTGWTSSDVTITNASSASTSFTMPAKNVTVTANWRYNGSGGSGNGSGSSGGSSSDRSTTTPITILPEKKPDQAVTAVLPISATAGANGVARVVISDKAISDAITKAQAESKAQGKTANGISLELSVTMPKGRNFLIVTLSQSSLNSLVSAGVKNLKINGYPVTISFDNKALAEIEKQSSGNVTITIKPAQNLNVAAKTLIGTRPVYDTRVSYVIDGESRVISAFNGGRASISLPYTPKKNEAIGHLYGVSVDAKGNATRIDGSYYDSNEGAILISTGHLLSVYGVGYTAPSANLKDIESHWAKEAIEYIVARGLLSGTSEKTFTPNMAMTRGMLVTALGKLAKADVSSYKQSSFTDVAADKYYTPYIEWAYKNGLVQGIGNQQFAPDRAITREELAIIFANYAKATGYKLPVIREASVYADADHIGSVYKTAVKDMQQAGIMVGASGNKFNPKSNATRAEVSSMLHNYIKLTMEPGTAQGWARNDVGQYLYYKDGKALTETQIIDGTKYFFNNNGRLKTGWVKDNAGNWYYYSENVQITGWWDMDNKRFYFNKDGTMNAGKWLEIDGKWYYFYADGSLALSTKIGEYEVDENGMRR